MHGINTDIQKRDELDKIRQLTQEMPFETLIINGHLQKRWPQRRLIKCNTPSYGSTQGAAKYMNRINERIRVALNAKNMQILLMTYS